MALRKKKIDRPESYRSAATTGSNSTKFRTKHPCVNGTSGFTNKGLINLWFFSSKQWYVIFYYVHWKDQRSAAVIILHYTMLRHNVLREVMHLFFWHNVKKSVHVKFTIMSITCRFHVSDVVLPCIFRSKWTFLW